MDPFGGFVFAIILAKPNGFRLKNEVIWKKLCKKKLSNRSP